MTRHSIIVVLLTGIAFGCSAFKTGPSNARFQETTVQQGLANLAAEVTAEISAVRAERDSFTGLTVQSAAPWTLMPLMAWQMLLSHRREIARLTKGGLK